MIQAEDFDMGGEGVAYHDLTSGNQGGQYRRAVHVDIASPYAKGYVVNNFQTGEWLEYTIRVTTSGVYRIEALVSSQLSTSRFHIEIDGVDRTGPVTVPDTGSWRTFRWIGKNGIRLTAGRHVLRIYVEEQYFSLDAIRIVREAGSEPTNPAVAAYAKGSDAAIVSSGQRSKQARTSRAFTGIERPLAASSYRKGAHHLG
jgi:hypothetical protein